jgi:hypothetical protein
MCPAQISVIAKTLRQRNGAEVKTVDPNQWLSRSPVGWSQQTLPFTPRQKRSLRNNSHRHGTIRRY